MTPDRSSCLMPLGSWRSTRCWCLPLSISSGFATCLARSASCSARAFLPRASASRSISSSGPRPSHYGLTILGAAAAPPCRSGRSCCISFPVRGAYGNAIFGLHLYTWALIAFALIVAGTAVMLLFDRQFVPTEWQAFRRRVLPISRLHAYLRRSRWQM